MRKCLGGTMRQTGYLAAACLFGLNQATEKLKIDHENALKLATGTYLTEHALFFQNLLILFVKLRNR
jgi:threonine aldolase